MNFFMAIRTYVIYNDFNKSPLGSGLTRIFSAQNPRILTENDSISGKPRLFLEIYDDTTLQNVKDIWKSHVEANKPFALQKLKKKTVRRRILKKFDRDERIYNLSIEKKKHKDIAQIIKEEFGGKKLSYDDVAKIIANFKQEIQEA